MSLRIAVLIPANSAQFDTQIMAAIEPVIPPDVAVSVHHLSQGSACIENRLDWTENAYPAVEVAKALAADGVDGIWLSDFDMCGVEAAREVIDIPIIGGFPTSAFNAMALGQKFSIITVLPSTLTMQQGWVSAYGLNENFASIRAIDCPVEQLSDTALVVRKVCEVGLQAIESDGAQTLLLGCTGFVGVAAAVSAQLSQLLGCYVPVIDPNQAGFTFLSSLARMRLRASGLCYQRNA